MEFSSKLIENAVTVFSKMPGIGKKSALRMVLFLLQKDEDFTKNFIDKVGAMRENIKFCKVCNNVSDDDMCAICLNPSRNNNKICVVENIRDVMAIENTGQFYGKYHVLGTLISPIHGIGPDDLNIGSFVEKVIHNKTEEIIMALSPTIEGDTTAYYISKKLKTIDVKITTIARGVAFGGELEYADELTLARSISNRLPFERYVNED